MKVVWTREEDIQHDMYRPYFFDRISAGLDDKGMPVAWNHRFAGSSIIARWLPPGFNNGLDPDTTEGAIDLVYALPNLHVEYVRVEPPGIPTAFWRSVGPSHNVFVTESFIDELAVSGEAGSGRLSAGSPRQVAARQGGPRSCGGKGRLGKALASRGRPWRLPPVRLRDLFGAGCRSRGGEGRSGSCPARRLRGRLRHRRQSRYRPGADPERDHLRHHGGAAWRDHAEGRSCRAKQFPRLPDAADERGAGHRGLHREQRPSRRAGWARPGPRRSSLR